MVVLRERARSPKFESRRGKLLRDGCACAARVKLGMRNVRRVQLTDIWSWYRVELRVGDHLGRSEELVSRCVECDLAEPESLASLGGSLPVVCLTEFCHVCHEQVEEDGHHQSNDIANTTPRKGQELCPLELFSGLKIAPKLWHFHAFGCPMYVLDNALQSGQ